MLFFYVGILLHVSFRVCSLQDFNGSYDEQMKDFKLAVTTTNLSVFPSLTQLLNDLVRLARQAANTDKSLHGKIKYLIHFYLACIR